MPELKIDLSDVGQRLAELRAEVARIDSAMSAAQEQQQVIGKRRHEIREAGRSGKAVADALLADPDSATGIAAMLAPDLSALDEEFQALGAALRDLRARRDETSRRMAEAEADGFALIGEALRPMVGQLEAKAIEHIEGLVATFADLAALTYGTRAGSHTTDRLRRAVGLLLGGADPLVQWRKVAPVSAPVRSTLAGLAAKCPNLPIPVTESTFLP